MKKWLLAVIFPALISCTTHDQDFYRVSQEKRDAIDSYDLPKHAINDVVKDMPYHMLESSTFVSPKTPVAVASFVNLADLESTNWLGNQLSENFVHELQRHGLIVVDFKTTGHNRVTESGDYVFTRDWKELPERQIIDYVVTGTMTEQETGILVNARMIGMQSRVVVATAQTFIPNWVIGEKINPNQNVKMKDGMIIRNSEMLNDEDRAVAIKN